MNLPKWEESSWTGVKCVEGFKRVIALLYMRSTLTTIRCCDKSSRI